MIHFMTHVGLGNSEFSQASCVTRRLHPHAAEYLDIDDVSVSGRCQEKHFA